MDAHPNNRDRILFWLDLPSRVTRTEINVRSTITGEGTVEVPSQTSTRTKIEEADTLARRCGLDDLVSDQVPVDRLGKNHVNDSFDQRADIVIGQNRTSICRADGNLDVGIFRESNATGSDISENLGTQSVCVERRVIEGVDRGLVDSNRSWNRTTKGVENIRTTRNGDGLVVQDRGDSQRYMLS